MRKFLVMTIIFAYISLISACTNHTDTKSDKSTILNSKSEPDFNAALKFINDYVSFCNQDNDSKIKTSDWINDNKLITEEFKKIYTELVEAAIKEDPELGLDFDPIFDAQDFPDNGFEILTYDNNTGYLTVTGIDMPQLKIVMKITQIDNNWLVDGSGVINIPKDKRAIR
jgi:hypothetical protein